ncbi:MAG: MSMEG_6728 family protein [Nocardioidaceae bacterium]
MQTFLPYPDFARSAQVLDDKRLGKQRVETLQIMHVLLGLRWNLSAGVIEAFEPKGWRNHPAVRMWRGYEPALLAYQDGTCQEWTRRGFNDTCYPKAVGLAALSPLIAGVEAQQPPWLGPEELHRSHQSNLIRKDPDIYAPLFPDVPADLPYFWPLP